MNKKPSSNSPKGFPVSYQIDQAACSRLLRYSQAGQRAEGFPGTSSGLSKPQKSQP